MFKMDGNGYTTIFLCKDLVHDPIEATIYKSYKWLFGFQEFLKLT